MPVLSGCGARPPSSPGGLAGVAPAPSSAPVLLRSASQGSEGQAGAFPCTVERWSSPSARLPTVANVHPLTSAAYPPSRCVHPLREPLHAGVRARAHCNIPCRKSAAGKGMKASSGGAYNRVLSRYRHADTHMHYCSREMMVCRCCWEEREPWYSTLPPRSTTTVGKPLIWNA